MFLKQLTLKGFKSFADTTTLDLEPGITVVVGPNGSGKSNVVDAIAWVLGAQAARAIRSNKMDDVIFAGTAKKAALGRAEVSLTIDNSDGRLPIGFSEVCITRTLFRSGESEYQINGTSTRLLDVQELLSDTGVGRQQHVIVSQGNLDAVLNSRPEDRRAVIEEAAGVLKFRKRRERAQRRLDATETGFVRLGDLLREIRRQLRPLERQAHAAERHAAITLELQALRIHTAGQEFAALGERSAITNRQRDELRRSEGDAIERLRRLEADVSTAESAMAGLAQVVAAEDDVVDDADPWANYDVSDALSRIEGLYEKARGQLALLGERRRSIERERNAFLDADVVAMLSGQAAQVNEELAELERRLESIGPRLFALDDTDERLNADRNDHEERWTVAEPETGESGESGPSAAGVRRELAAAQQAVDRARAEQRRVDDRARSLAVRGERTHADYQRAEGELERLNTEVERISASTADASQSPRAISAAQLVAADAALAVAEDRARSAEGEGRAWTARRDALAAALDEAHARAGAQRLAGLDGVVGTLLDLVEIDAGWEAAFEAGAGEALAAVVVRDVATAREALARVQSQGASGAVIALAAASTSQPLSLFDTTIGDGLRRHVRSSDDAVSAALDVVLAGVVVVDGSLNDAIEVILARPGSVVVTRSGDRLSASGWRAGSGAIGATAVALEEARNRAEAAQADTSAAAAELAAARIARRDASAAVENASRAEANAVRERDKLISAQNTARALLERLSREMKELQAESVVIAAQLDEAAAMVTTDLERTAELEAALPALVAAEESRAERETQRRAEKAVLDARGAEQVRLRRALDLEVAELEGRRRVQTERQIELEERLSRSVAEREAAEARRFELDILGERTEAIHAVVLETAELLEVGLADLRERRRRQSEAARAATQRLEALRTERTAVERVLGGVRERLRSCELEETELRLRTETLGEQIRREFELDPFAAVMSPAPTLPAGVEAKVRIGELEKELRQIGPVNPLALEEYEAIKERASLLEAQLEDIKTTRRELEKVIKAIDDEITTVFSQAFADVSTHFEQLFSVLFPGGQGVARLTDPENLLETGVEIEARPSGKNVRKLSLLSGGERSLTALAFLFAVFRSRPSPFYVMDEVEAALDDLNLSRFLDLVHEFRLDAQLLIVSHQRRTMEAADVLYGVSMQPGGSSKAVSERLAPKAPEARV